MELLQLTLRREEQVIFLGIFPTSISVILIIVGTINPQFFKKSEIKIPIISDVDVSSNEYDEEVFVTYDITAANCFLRTAEPLGLGEVKLLRFECPNFSSVDVRGEVVWENHINKQDAIGTVLKLTYPTFSFIRFLARYYIFRSWKGIVFLLKLPGFERTRKLFMRPITTMQEDRILKAGTVVFKEGDVGKEFYLLKKGTVIFYKTVESGEIITMDTVESGQIFGEMAITGNLTRAATAKCLTDCILASADRDNMNALIVSNVEFAKTLIQTMTRRLENSEKILIENINQLEKQKKEGERIFHVAMLLTLLGLGYNPKEGNLNVKLDFKKISEVLKRMDDDVASEIINLVMMKQEHRSEDTEEMVDDEITAAVDKLYENFNINIKL